MDMDLLPTYSTLVPFQGAVPHPSHYLEKGQMVIGQGSGPPASRMPRNKTNTLVVLLSLH